MYTELQLFPTDSHAIKKKQDSKNNNKKHLDSVYIVVQSSNGQFVQRWVVLHLLIVHTAAQIKPDILVQCIRQTASHCNTYVQSSL